MLRNFPLLVVILGILSVGISAKVNYTVRISSDKPNPELNENFQLTCELISHSVLEGPQEYTWFKYTDPIHNGSQLNFRPFKPSDYARYYCSVIFNGYTGANKVRQEKKVFPITNTSTEYTLGNNYVDNKARSPYIKVYPIDHFMFNVDTNFICELSGRWKHVIFNWYKDGVRSLAYYNSIEYHVKQFSLRDLGIYVCEITGFNLDTNRWEKHMNGKRYGSKLTKETVTKNFHVEITPETRLLYGQPYILFCEIKYDRQFRNITYRWFKDQILHSLSSSQRLYIAQFSFENRGKYRCEVSGIPEVINSQVSFQATYTIPYAKEKSYTTRVIVAKHLDAPFDLMLTCLVEPHLPNTKYAWTKDGKPMSAIEGNIVKIPRDNTAEHSGTYTCDITAIEVTTGRLIHQTDSYIFHG